MRNDHDDNHVAEVAAWMERLATEPLPLQAPPDPGLIWLKAQMLRRWDAHRQTTASIDLGESVQVGVGAAGSLLLLLLFMWRGGAAFISSGPSLAIGMAISLVLLASAVIVAFPAATGRQPQHPSPRIRSES
jgi:hypothetical protein